MHSCINLCLHISKLTKLSHKAYYNLPMSQILVGGNIGGFGES